MSRSHRCDALCIPAIRLYEQGLSLVETGSRLSVSAMLVYGRLRRHGIACRPRGRGRKGLATPWSDHAVMLRNDGRTLQEIGTVVGVTSERVRQVLRQIGIPTQKRHRCNDACTVVFAATPPVSVTQLARQAQISWARIQRAVQIHHIPTSRCHHVCTDWPLVSPCIASLGSSAFQTRTSPNDIRPIIQTGIGTENGLYRPAP